MWSASPGSNIWNTDSNWLPATVPTNIATFGASNTTSIAFLPFIVTSIGTLQFNPGAPPYSFTTFAPLFTPIRITGAGIVNDSSNPPTFIVGNQADLLFLNTSTAGNATIITNAGGITGFEDGATGGNARFITNAGGVFDISSLSTVGMTAGSIEGAGSFVLGSKQLTVGSNNLSTEVSGVISGTGGSLVKVGTGTLTLSGANTYTGPTTITDGAINLTGSLVSPVTVEPGGTLGSTGTVFNTVTNAGTVAPGLGLPATVFGALTVNSYVGAGGTLALRTFLGADNSPSDQLVINGGSATGNSLLRITNAGGPGAETTGNGIPVVVTINGGTTAPGAIMLGGEVRAGAFDYDLFRGGLNGTNPNNWFLRSTFIVSPTPGPEEPIAPSPPPGPLPPGVWPIIGPELATDGVVQPIARQIGLQMLGTLHQRIGDTLTLANTGGEGSGLARSDWARFFGQGIDNSYQAFADPRASGWLGGFQGGIDLLRSSFWLGHRDVAGVYGAFANSNITVNGLVTNATATGYVQSRTGTVGLNGYSAGGYWTHYGPSGWYLDAVLQGTYYSGNAITQSANLPINGSGFISSLEGGYPIPLPLGPLFVLEPQAQIIWQQVSFNQANDGLGPVGLGTTSGTTGRVGLRGMWTIDGYNGQVWQPYVRANLWRDWGAEATTLFGIDPVPLIEEATRLEFAGGLTAKIGPGVSLYAQAGYQFALDNAFIRNGIQGDIGLRYVW
jgi:outer membrane autotransporter protein